MPVDLLLVAVLLEHAAQHAHPPHPQQLGGQPRLARSVALACRDTDSVQLRSRLCLWLPLQESRQNTRALCPSLSRAAVPEQRLVTQPQAQAPAAVEGQRVQSSEHLPPSRKPACSSPPGKLVQPSNTHSALCLKQHCNTAQPASRTWPAVPALGLGLLHRACARARVDLLGLPDDEAVLDELADVEACTGGRSGTRPGDSKPCRAIAGQPRLSAGLDMPQPLSHGLRGSRGARELAMEISLTSLGSSQTLRTPQSSTEAASRFCSFRDTMAPAPTS